MLLINGKFFKKNFECFFFLKKELPSKLLEKTASKAKGKMEEQTLSVMDKSTHEEVLSQPLQHKN